MQTYSFGAANLEGTLLYLITTQFVKDKTAKTSESNVWDPTYMTSSKDGDERELYFTDLTV